MITDWKKAKLIVEKYKTSILSIPGVVGLSTGVNRDREEPKVCIRVYLSKHVSRGKLEENKIPRELEGVLVDIILTGDIRAFGNCK